MSSLSQILVKKHDKLEVLSQFKKELIYVNLLSNKVLLLKNIKKNDLYKNFFLKESYNNFFRTQNFLVVYIISISFLKANTMIHISDIKGNVKLFFNAGQVNLSGKQKRRRAVAVLRLMKLIYRKASFLFGKPIALHFNNVNRHKKLIVNKLSQKFFIKIVREFNQVPYNGCRRSKIRRKKYKKKIV